MNRLFYMMLSALLLLLPMTASAADNQWSGTLPFSTGLGNLVITALAVSADGKTVYAGNGSGTVFSYDIKPPLVTTSAATVITTGSATLNGAVNAFNADAVVSFEYGLTTAYGLTAAVSQSPVGGSSDIPVSASVSGLTPGATYHYRVKAVNNVGTVYGDDMTFAALPGFTLTITKTGSGTGIVTGAGCSTLDWIGSIGRCTATSGTDITLSPVADTGSFFNGWNSGNGSLKLSQDTAVTATFSKKYTVTLSPVSNGILTPNTLPTVNEGATASFTIIPAVGYHIAIPVGGNCPVGTFSGSPYDSTNGISYSTGAITANCSVDATFIQSPAYNIVISNSASSNGFWGGNSWIPTGSGSNVKASEILDRLAVGNVTVNTNSAAGETGDITIAVPLTWSVNQLTLNASRHITINAVMSVSGSSSLAMNSTTGTVRTGLSGSGFYGRVDFPGRSGSGFLSINNDGYTVINSLGAEYDFSGENLQGINGVADTTLSRYALGADIDATVTNTWTMESEDYAGFMPLGYSGGFAGVFDGLGHTIINMTIHHPSSSGNVGLFDSTTATAVVRNLGLTGGVMNGLDYVGALVGINAGTITNSYSSATVTGSDYVGGLVGQNEGTIDHAYSSADVTAHDFTGGLVGWHVSGSISDSFSSGAVSGNYQVGGLVGVNHSFIANYCTISNAYSSGSVTANDAVGGLAGSNYGLLNNVYASGKITASTRVGGLVGYLNLDSGGTVTNSFWDADTTTLSAGYDTLVNTYGATEFWTGNAPLYSSTSTTAFNPASYAGWDISNVSGSGKVWRIYEGQSYPLLASYLTPLTVIANDAVKTYDGSAYSGGNGVSYSATPNANLLGSPGFTGTSQGATAVGIYGITPYGLYSNQQGYDISYVGGTLTILPTTLTVTIIGNGSVTSNNNNGINDTCMKSNNGGICNPVAFGFNDTVTLTATGSNSTFDNWSGADYTGDPSVNPGSIIIDGNKALTATFTPDKAKVRIGSDSNAYYTLDAALAAAPTPVLPALATEIRAQSLPTVFSEDIIMTNPISILLKGGYDDENFANQAGYTTVRGSLKIRNGKLLVERLNIKGQ